MHHGRLRFHHRAPNGSAGASRSRPAIPSGTIVATVNLEGVLASSYERRTPQFAASFGTLSSNTSRSPVANVAAEVEIETDRSVGLAIDPRTVVADPSVTVFEAIGLSDMMSFELVVDTDVVVVADIAPELVWTPSKTARLTLVPAVGFPSAVMPLGVDIAVMIGSEKAATIMSPLTVVVIVGVECVVPLVAVPDRLTSSGFVVSTPMYEPIQPAIGPVTLGVNV
jgi:hypothetical protein